MYFEFQEALKKFPERTNVAVLRNLGCERALRLRIARALNIAVTRTSPDGFLIIHR